MQPTWTQIEDAIIAWIRAGSGLNAEYVLWESQNAPKPDADQDTDGTWISVNVLVLDTIGIDWRDYKDADNPQPGAELTVEAKGSRLCEIRLQCYTDPRHRRPNAGIQILDNVKLADRLNDAVGFASFGPATFVGFERTKTIFEPRAVMTGQFFLVRGITGTATFIEFVDTTITPS